MDYLVVDTCQVVGLNEIYKKYFGYKEDGCFVEIGAADGVTWSNTYGLYHAGWKGLMYEPDREAYKRCVENLKDFPKVKIYQVAIGNKSGIATLYAAGLGGSTISEEYLKAIQLGNGWHPEGTYIVSVMPLDKSLFNEGILENEIDVISIDTEGNEPEILEGFSIDYWKPKMVIIEAHELYPAQDRPKTADRINKYFDEHKYTKIYCDQVNNIYVPCELGM